MYIFKYLNSLKSDIILSVISKTIHYSNFKVGMNEKTCLFFTIVMYSFDNKNKSGRGFILSVRN